MIYLLFILLVLLLILSFYINNKEFASPAFAFVGSFTFSCFWAALYAKKWDLNLNFNTFFIILFGAIIFVFISYITRKKYNKSNKESTEDELKYINIKKYKKILFLIFILLMTIISIYYTVKSVDGNFTNIRTTLYKYRNYTAFQGKDVNIPFFVSATMGLIHCSAYWFLYVTINNYLVNRKIDYLSLIISIVCGLTNLIEGNRGGILNFLVSIVPIYLLLKMRTKEKNIKINIKGVIIVCVIATALLFGLKLSAQLIGRDDVKKINTMDYIAMYSGAEIKNLDLFLQEKHENPNFLGINTFNSLMKPISKIGGFYEYFEKNTDVGTFRKINGYNLGNVYTIYYSFITDFGYFGFIPLIILMSLVIQIIYENSKYKIYKMESPNIYILIYGFIFGGLIFCFFGNKLINQAISISFVQYVIAWYVLNYIFVKLEVKNKN